VSSAAADLTPGQSQPGYRPRVLVAEDEPALLRAMSRALRYAGFEVLTATNGREAVEILAVSEVDAVLSDIRMPEHGWIQLLRAVREKSLELPVILITASPEFRQPGSHRVRRVPHNHEPVSSRSSSAP